MTGVLSALTIGEAMVELRPRGDGFTAGVAGDVYNTGALLAGLGWNVAHAQDLGRDVHLARLRDDLAARSVRWVGRELPGRTNGMYLVAVDEHGERRFQYHRAGSAAAETAADPKGVLARAVAEADLVYLTGVTVAITTDLAPLLRLLERARGPVAVGLNLREGLYRRRGGALLPRPVEQVAADLRSVLQRATLLFGSSEEYDALDARHDGRAFARRWQLERPERTAVMTAGSRGVCAWHGGGVSCADPPSVTAVDTSGAGDALAAAVLDAVLRGATVDAALAAGAAAGAQAVSHEGALPPRPQPSDTRSCTIVPGDR
jgi:2-dehydro-3-deoxygluconokinase